MARYSSEFIGLDLEATDLSTDSGRIIEVGAVKFIDGKEVAKFQSLIDPGQPIPPIITSITGIREQDVMGQPKFDAVRDELAAFVGKAPIVGHNIAFDISFLKAQGLALKNATYDTWKLATMLVPRAGSHSLEALAQELGLKHPNAHRALDDARVGAELFVYLTEALGNVPPEVARQMAQLVRQHPYSLGPVFLEVFGEHGVAAKPKRRSTKKEVATAQQALPLGTAKKSGEGSNASEKITGAWKRHKKKSKKSAKTDAPFEDLHKVFTEQIVPKTKGFELRAEQVEAARTLRGAIKAAGISMVEIGAGIGRREAAIVAALSTNASAVYTVATNHELSVVSQTATTLASALGGSEIAVLDQPGGYVSLNALEKFLAHPSLSETDMQFAMKVLAWLPGTATGRLTELALVWEEKLLVPEISARLHDCGKDRDPGACSYCAALERAQHAKLVLMTHATMLWTLDNPDVLKAKALIIDDAEQLEENATNVYGTVLHQNAFERLVDRTEQLAGDPKVIEDWRNQLALVSGVIGLFVERLAREIQWDGGRTVVIDLSLAKDPGWEKLKGSLQSLASRLGKLAQAQPPLAEGVRDIQAKIENVLTSDAAREVIQVGLNDRLEFVFRIQPIEISQVLNKKLFTSGTKRKVQRAIVLVGPRLRVAGAFTYIKRRLGIPDNALEYNIAGVLPSAERAAVITLADMPDPMASNWPDVVSQVASTLVSTLGGRTLVLFSNKSQVLAVHGLLESQLKGTGTKLLAQGLSGGRGKTLHALVRHEKSVLLGSFTFTDRLKFSHGFNAIVVCKLPFAVPGDPLRTARGARVSSSFMELELPRVALKVREQFDRLLASKHDRGVLVVLDSKFQKSYGQILLDTLPSVPLISSELSKLAKDVAVYRKPETLSKRTPKK